MDDNDELPARRPQLAVADVRKPEPKPAIVIQLGERNHERVAEAELDATKDQAPDVEINDGQPDHDEASAGPDEEAEGSIDAGRLKALRKQAKAEREALLKDFNQRYMVVNDGGSVRIFSERDDVVLKRRVYDRMTPGALDVLYANCHVCTRITDKGERSYKPVAKWWLTHKERRQYIHGVTFDPSGATPREGVLNLWRGFAFTPKPGSWHKLKEHIRLIICRGNEEHHCYLMGWMARLVQSPAKPGEVAIVLRGGQGSGKGTLGQGLRRLLGQHGMHISSSKHLVGNFNGHLRDCVFLFADEAFYAGDKASLSTLRAIITETVLTIEPKRVDAIQCPNMLHILMASNSEWVVPAALDERRYFVLDVSHERQGDLAYFQAIHAEMEAGGYEAMLHELLAYDLSRFNVRSVPTTDALQDQKKRSLDTKLDWWRDVLMRGYVFKSKLGLEADFGDWHEIISTELLFDGYSDHAKSRGERHPMSREDLGKFMHSMGCKPTRPRGKIPVGEHWNHKSRAEPVYKERPPSYRLGTLEQARQAFEATTKLHVKWESTGPAEL